MTRLLLLSCLALLPSFAHADTPQQILAAYQQQAGGASAARGEKFSFAKVTQANGEVVGCASCHTDNPKAIGKTRAHKTIEPLAPVISATLPCSFPVILASSRSSCAARSPPARP